MAEALEFHIRGIRMATEAPSALDEDAWRAIQGLEREAFRAGLEGWSPQEVDSLVHWDEPDYFRDSRINPVLAQERGDFRKKQDWRKPLVTVAYDGDVPVAYTYMSDNVSGKTPLG